MAAEALLIEVYNPQPPLTEADKKRLKLGLLSQIPGGSDVDGSIIKSELSDRLPATP